MLLNIVFYFLNIYGYRGYPWMLKKMWIPA